MRHRHGYNRLGRDPLHRRALLKNMAIALVKHERIVTTLTKAKEIRRTGDMMIGLAKKDTEHSRQKAWNWLRHPDLMTKLFGSLRERYVTRPGGYTRVLRAPNRKGDNAPMAVVELVGNRYPPMRAGRDSLRAPLPLFSERDLLSLTPEETLSDALSELHLNTDASEETASDSDPAPQVVSSSERQKRGPTHHGNERQTKDIGTPV